MNIQANIPAVLTMQQTCIVIGMSQRDTTLLGLAKHIEEVPGGYSTASIGAWLMDTKGWEQDYTELFIYQSIQP